MSDTPRDEPQSGPQPTPPGPKAVKPNGSAPDTETSSTEGAKKGLTLDSLERATALGSAVPLASIKSVAVTIDIQKPEKGVPFRAHPDVNYTRNGYSLTVRTPGVIGDTIYLLDPAIAELIPSHVRYQMFALCFDAWQRKPFIWPITVPVEGARGNSWTSSAMRVWGAAKEDWVCLIPGGGAYQLHKPVVPVTGKPEWPSKSFAELMIMGFRDLYIGSDDHDHKEIVKRLTTYIPEEA